MLRRFETISLSVLLGVALLVALPVPTRAQQPELLGDVPSSGIALVSWSGGTVDELLVAAGNRGCHVRSLWVSNSGLLVGYLVGAPDFANGAFLSLYPGAAMPGSTALILVCVQQDSINVPIGQRSGTGQPGDLGMPLLSYAEHHGFVTFGTSAEGIWNRIKPCVWEPVLSPDAQWVACTSGDALHVIGADGSVARVPGVTIWPGLTAWSPDSKVFAFVVGEDLNLLRVADASLAVVDDVSADSGAYLRQVFPQLSWTADSSHIAFTCGRPGARAVCVADANGQFLYEIAASTGAPAWSPAENIIAYECIKGLCISELGATEGAVLFGQAGRPIWSPSGDELIASDWVERWYEDCSQLVVISSRGALRATLTEESECASTATWSPDGSQVAFTIGTQFGDFGAGVVRRDGSDHRVLWSDGWHVSRPVWSPDGTLVASARSRIVDTGVSTTETIVDSATSSASWVLPGWEITAWPSASGTDGSVRWPAIRPSNGPNAVAPPPLEPTEGFVVEPEFDLEDRCLYQRCMKLTEDRSWLVPDGGFAGGYEGEWFGYPIWRASGWWNDYEYVSGLEVDYVRVTPTGCQALNANAPPLGSNPLDQPEIRGGDAHVSGQALCDRQPLADGVWVYLYTRDPQSTLALRGVTQVIDGHWELDLDLSGQNAFKVEFVTPSHRIEALPSSGIDDLTETLHLTPENDTLDWLLDSGLASPEDLANDLARLWGRQVHADAGVVEQLAPEFFQMWVKVGGSTCCRVALRFERLGDVAWAGVWDRRDGVITPWSAPAAVTLEAVGAREALVEWNFLTLIAGFEFVLEADAVLRAEETLLYADPDRNNSTSLQWEPGPLPSR